jgi:hypothetical protein
VRFRCSTDSDKEEEGQVADLEDLGGPAKQAASNMDHRSASHGSGGTDERKQMLSPPLRAALGKQGYKLIGPRLFSQSSLESTFAHLAVP